MSRLRQPRLLEQIKELSRVRDELKSAQFSGGDSLQGYVTSSSGLNDWSAVIPKPAGTMRSYILTFTPATAGVTAIVQLFLFYSINQPDVMSYWVQPWANGPSVVAMTQPLPPQGTSTSWYITFQNNDQVGVNYTVYAKFLFSGTDTGTWTMVSA